MERRHAETVARRDQFGSRLNEHMSRRDFGRADRNIAERTLHTGYIADRRPYLHTSYHDRPDLIVHRPHHLYSYYDMDHHMHHRVIYPSFYFGIGYRFGPHFCYSYVYPYYHRKYVFISLGGYWPDDYMYMRYYWYGYHPYVWYGYYPVATEVVGTTNNYYTYNYYNSDGTATTYQSADAQDAYTAVNAPATQARPEPAPQTQADTRFEEAVKSFEAGDYGVAADKFARALELSPEDMILPFAYAQALFADEQYTRAADVLRQALKKVTPEKEGVFYPRGLYANDDVLFKQIEKLMNKQEESGDNTDLQLLLGYHLLGTGETGYAREPLEQAGQDERNTEAVAVMLRLLDKLEKEATPAEKVNVEPQAAPEAQSQTQSVPAVAAPSSGASVAPTVEAAPGGQSTPTVEVNNVPDAAGKDTAAPLTAGAGTSQVPDQLPANKETGNEP